jgi:putative DNA primase/helicase
MVRGCLAWHQEGLGMSPAVKIATAKYREESDHVGKFIEECCVLGETQTITRAALWDCYKKWTEQNEDYRFRRRSSRKSWRLGV